MLSMVFTLRDDASSKMNTVRATSKHLSKDLDALSQDVEQLNQRQQQAATGLAKAQTHMDKMSTALREAKKNQREFNDELSELRLEKAHGAYNQAKADVQAWTKELKDAKAAIDAVDDAQRKSENRSSGTMSIAKVSAINSLTGEGLKMLGQVAQQGANAFVGSAFGDEAGTMFSSGLSSAVSGAALGSMIAPGIGTAIGAVLGGVVGVASGAIQNFEKQDDAFKAYVQETTEAQLESINDGISNGSSIASGRERDLISFATLFGSRDTAKSYLGDLVDMANTTPFLYDDLTAMSKTLATYGYGAKEILPALKTIGDAGAALGMETSDMTMVATALGRMKSSGKTTLEYLNILNDRGIGAVGMLADHYKVSQGEIYNMISKGQLEGGQTVKIITEALQKQFSGSMAEQSKTYGGLSSTMEGLEQELDNAYGEGYNEERKKGMREQIDFLGGESGASMQEANRAMGAWKASLENEAEELERTAIETVLTGITSDKFSKGNNRELRALADEYADSKKKYLDGDEDAYAQMGYALARAKVIAQNEYNATDGAKLARESELGLAEAIRSDTQSNDAYWNAGYEKGQQYTKGLARGISDDKSIQFSRNVVASGPVGGLVGLVYDWAEGKRQEKGAALNSHAAGLFRVPYDRYKAELHEGERVLTASETRQADRAASPNINITVNVDGSAAGNDKDLAVTVAQEIVKNLAQAKKLYAR